MFDNNNKKYRNSFYMIRRHVPIYFIVRSFVRIHGGWKNKNAFLLLFLYCSDETKTCFIGQETTCNKSINSSNIRWDGMLLLGWPASSTINSQEFTPQRERIIAWSLRVNWPEMVRYDCEMPHTWQQYKHKYRLNSVFEHKTTAHRSWLIQQSIAPDDELPVQCGANHDSC